jgi:hypothetical protein
MRNPTMQMFLPNGTSTSAQMAAFASYSANLASVPKTIKTAPALNTSMIGRIHNAKSGCGSCGRK